MDLTVLNLALPALSEDLQPSSSQFVDRGHLRLHVAGLLITMGTLGDRIGRRRLLLDWRRRLRPRLALAAPHQLIAARALLGVAGATLAPSTLSLIRNMFQNPQERTFAIGVVDHELDRSGGRAADRRVAAGAVLVGLGVPAHAPRDGAAARGGARVASRVPGSRGGQVGLDQRGHVARRRAGGDLRSQTDRPGRRRSDPGCVDRRRPGRRCGVRSQAA